MSASVGGEGRSCSRKTHLAVLLARRLLEHLMQLSAPLHLRAATGIGGCVVAGGPADEGEDDDERDS